MPDETRLPLPSTLPEDTWCIKLQIPASTEYMQVLIAALEKLSFWNTWDRDESRTAREVALLWRETLETIVLECGIMDVRQNTELPCKLEKTEDGTTWVQFANLRLCVPYVRMAGSTLQTSVDGTTWQNQPDAGQEGNPPDPRTDGPINPARTGSNVPCLSAANAVAVFVELHRELSVWYNAIPVYLSFLYSIGAALQSFFYSMWQVFGLTVNQIDLATNILAHQSALNESAFTSQIQSDLTTILYCNADSNGQWNQAEYDTVVSQIAGKTGDMWALIGHYLSDVAGIVGLNNAGTTTSVSIYDCSEMLCGEWCHVWFGESGDYDDYTLVAGTLVSNGIRATSHEGSQNMAHVAFPLPAGSYTVTQVRVNWTNEGGGPRGTAMLNETYWSGSGELGTAYPGPLYIAGLSIEPGNYIGVQINADYDNQSTLIGFELRGIGANPWFENCTE